MMKPRLLSPPSIPETKVTVSVRPVPMPVYPTFTSLQDVLDYSESKLPILGRNDLKSILFTYHNTLLAQIAAQEGSIKE